MPPAGRESRFTRNSERAELSLDDREREQVGKFNVQNCARAKRRRALLFSDPPLQEAATHGARETTKLLAVKPRLKCTKCCRQYADLRRTGRSSGAPVCSGKAGHREHVAEFAT